MVMTISSMMVSESKLSSMVLNKLYDKRDVDSPKANLLFSDMRDFCKENKLIFPEIKRFEYLFTVLCSGHRYGGSVLDVGTAKSMFPYYLASRGYDVTTLDTEDESYRKTTGDKFGVKTLVQNLKEFDPTLENKFDLVSSLSVIEHIDNDVAALVNLCRYTKPGGVLVVSTDFYDKYIEYPDANRKIVLDRPKGSHTDSRVYDVDRFMRLVKVAEKNNMRRVGLTDYTNVDINDPKERAVRGLYTFGIAIFKKGYYTKSIF